MSQPASSPTAASTFFERVSIENFRCFRKVDVRLKPLTAVIGPNDTGKSVFLSALRKIALRDQAHDPANHFREDTSLVVTLTGHGAGGFNRISSRGGLTEFHLPEFGGVVVFKPPADGVSMQSQGHQEGNSSRPPDLNERGDNVAALVDFLLRRDRGRFFALIKKLKELVPGLEDIDVATPDVSLRRIDLVIEKDFRIPADKASAGVRLLIFFVSLAYHPFPPKLILVEEPENGIHPRRLADVIWLFREITQGLHGAQPAQVVLTTHSPYLLDYMALDTDQVLIARREPDGSRTIVAPDRERLKGFLEEFKLGEVWFNQGEEGLWKKGE